MRTDRDLLVLELLYLHRYMTTGQIARKYFSSITVCRRRLHLLHTDGLTDRYDRYNYPNGKLDLVHWLTPAGCREIGRPVKRTQKVNPNYLNHYLLLNDHLLAKTYDTYEIEPVTATGYRPDAYAEKTVLGVKRAYWIELDTGSESEARIAHKISAYEAIYRGAVRYFPYVLFIAPEKRLKTLQAWVEKHRKVRELIYLYEKI
jgi:hypothetical protein